MNEFEDVKKQLEVKNKEIYQNKLNLDLDNNLEVLVLTIDNLLNSLKKEAITNIIEIKENPFSEKSIQKNVAIFFETYQDNLMNFLDYKRNDIKNIIILQDDLEICKNNLQDNYQTLKEKIESSSKDLLKILEKELTKDLVDKFRIKRIKAYLNDILLINLNNKVLDIIKNRDLILINTFKETYLKYLELNKNTIGV